MILHVAARKGYLGVVAVLIKTSNNDACNELGNTPLHVAAIYRYPEVAGSLLLYSSLIEAMSNMDRTPPYLATAQGCSVVVSFASSLLMYTWSIDSNSLHASTPS